MNRRPVRKLALLLDDEEYALDDDQLQKLNGWLTNVIARIDKKNEKSPHAALARHLEREGEVYAGVIGGNLTISFTPTGMGTVTKVTENVTGEVLDLTDYECW